MRYKNLKQTLRNQIKNSVQVLWTWKKGEDEEFTMIYKAYGDTLPIYTPAQLLDLLTEEDKELAKNK
jgi:hypothetical protein|tara:strand:+ start:5869 stop:6069 length:201 start_codon:yes stop_codon:yes gene_type:complete